MDTILEERTVCVGARSERTDVEIDICTIMAQKCFRCLVLDWGGPKFLQCPIWYKVMLDRELYHPCEGCPNVWDLRAPGSTKLFG